MAAVTAHSTVSLTPLELHNILVAVFSLLLNCMSLSNGNLHRGCSTFSYRHNYFLYND